MEQSPTVDPLDELNQIRLSEDLSYEELAEQIRRAADGEIDRTVLFRALNDRGRKPRDRTIYKIQQFLNERAAKKSRARPRRRRRPS